MLRTGMTTDRLPPAADGGVGIVPAQAGTGLERCNVVVVGVTAAQRLAESGRRGLHGQGSLQVSDDGVGLLPLAGRVIDPADAVRSGERREVGQG